MKYNTLEVAALQPDYLGFIFYDRSPRNFAGEMPNVPKSIQKVGVFVNAPIREVIHTMRRYSIAIVQLHGDESPAYCEQLRKEFDTQSIELWKVFSVGQEFNFENLKPYENIVDKFLFDTSGAERGGNGIAFNWNILKEYASKTPFILSGGIGLDEVAAIKELAAELPQLFTIDVNSKLEITPGNKNIKQLEQFMQRLS